MAIDAVMSRITEIRQDYLTVMNQGATARRMPMGGPEVHSTAPAQNVTPTSNSVGANLQTSGIGGAPFPGSALPGLDTQTPGINFGDLLTQEIAKVTGPAPVTEASGTETGNKIVAESKKWLGVPYKWGGNSMAGVDCSGLVKNVLSEFGIDMPRVARDQMKMGTEVPSLDQARPGDLVVFNNGTHIGIYAGDGKMVDAPQPGYRVQFRDVYETPTTIRRITGEPSIRAGAA